MQYHQAIPKILITTALLTGMIGGSSFSGLNFSGLNLESAIAQNINTSRDRQMEILKRSGKRWIEIRLRSQRIIAWQGNRLVYATLISSGKSSTPTPMGVFQIQTKYPVARMQGDDYNIPDVPNVMYYSGNYAIHGAYWHRSFGIPVSQGCTNLAPDHAAWFYRWASVGTTVVVR